MSFADMMTLLFCLFMVLFAISSVNTSKFEALQKSLQDAFSGAVLDGGKSMLSSGSQQPTRRRRPSVEPPLPSLRPLTAHQGRQDVQAVRRGGREGQAGGAGLPRAQAPDRQARQGRGPAGQGQRDHPAPRPGDPAAHRQGVLRVRHGDAASRTRTEPGRQDRRSSCAASASTRSSSRATPTRSRSRARSTPVQLGAVRRSRRRSRSATSPHNGVNRPAGLRRHVRQPGARSTAIPRREGRAKNRRVEIVLSRINAPVTTDTESTP